MGENSSQIHPFLFQPFILGNLLLCTQMDGIHAMPVPQYHIQTHCKVGDVTATILQEATCDFSFLSLRHIWMM